MGINSPTEVPPTEETVRALLRDLVRPTLKHNDGVEEIAKGVPSTFLLCLASLLKSHVHAAAVLYNYYHLKQHPDQEFLEFVRFCSLAIKFEPSIQQHMQYMNLPNRPNLNDPENQLSKIEKAIMNACTLSQTLRDASSNISDMIKEWPVTKVAVFLIDSKKENWFLKHVTGLRLLSVIEKDLCFEGSGLGSESKKVSLKREYDEGDDGLKEVACSAVKEVAGTDSKLEVLEDHVVYSLNQEKTATRFYIVQGTPSISKLKSHSIELTISRLRGPVIKKLSDSWVTGRAVDYYYLLPYVDIISKWFSRSEGDNNSKGVDKPLVCLPKGNMKAKMHKRTLTNAISQTDNVKNMINKLKVKRVDGEKKSGIVTSHEDKKGMLVLDHGVAKTRPLQDFQSIDDAQRSKLSETALRALLNKKQKLSNQRPNKEDELALCEIKIQKIMQGGIEDCLGLKLEVLIDYFNESCQQENMQIQERSDLKAGRSLSLSEAHFTLRKPCEEFDDICLSNSCMLPTYHMSLPNDSRVNMYFSKKVAEKRLNALKLNDPKMYADYEVSFYPLSDVLQLMMDDDESSFRLIPELEQMEHAEKKISWREKVSPEIREKVSWPDDDTLPEVPVFKPTHFLVTINNTTYRPLYFRWVDLRKTKQVISRKKCTPTIDFGDFMVTDFMAVIRRMMDDSNDDWNNVMFISPGQDFVAD